MKKEEKVFFVDNLSESLKSASAVVLIDYTGLTVKKQQELKKELKKVSASLLVVKNTLFKIAGKNANLDAQICADRVLQGPMALVVTEGDPIAPLQVLSKFSMVNNLPQFKVGIVEGNFQEKQTLERLAKLPGKEVLFGQVVGSVSAPLYGIVGVMSANMQKLVYILNVKAQNSLRVVDSTESETEVKTTT